MSDSEPPRLVGQLGLCATCRNARLVPGSKGAIYCLCQLSARDAVYSKYPHLPMLSCPGHERIPA